MPIRREFLRPLPRQGPRKFASDFGLGTSLKPPDRRAGAKPEQEQNAAEDQAQPGLELVEEAHPSFWSILQRSGTKLLARPKHRLGVFGVSAGRVIQAARAGPRPGKTGEADDAFHGVQVGFPHSPQNFAVSSS